MKNAGLVALSQQLVLRREMDAIANNIANASTDGYKAQRMLFATFLQSVGNREKAAFVQDIAIARDLRDGSVATTGNTLDLAIRGRGYFQIDTPDGVRYTRGGHFRLDEEGVLVTSQGHPLLGEDDFPIITFPNDSEIVIGADGTVTSENIEIGRLVVVDFENPAALRKLRDGLYETDQPPLPAEDASVLQGTIEASNVEPIVEMTRMISLLRSYQGAQRLAQEQDQLRRRAISVLSGTSRNA